MGKSNKSKGPFKIGKGKVTPTQIAFMVDRYLHKNRFFETRSIFRNEASSLLSKCPLSKVPESLIPLEDILNEYICLKEEKTVVDQERVVLDQEKIVSESVAWGTKCGGTYNSSLSLITPPQVVAPSSQNINYGITSSGCGQYNTPSVMPVSFLGNRRVDSKSFSTPLESQAITRKRKGPEVSVVAPPISRKPRTTTAEKKSTANEENRIPHADNEANNLSTQALYETQTMTKKCETNKLMTGDVPLSVAECLFNKADSSVHTNSTCLRTLQKHASSLGSDKCNIPQNELEVTPANFTSYSVERSQLVSSQVQSNKRDHVKGRLNFDDTDTEKSLKTPASTALLVATSPSGSDPEVDFSDMDFSDIDFLVKTFELSELLDDFDLAYGGNILNPSIETDSWFSPELGNGYLEPNQSVFEYTKTVNELIPGNDMSTQGDYANTAATKVTSEMYMDLESC